MLEGEVLGRREFGIQSFGDSNLQVKVRIVVFGLGKVSVMYAAWIFSFFFNWLVSSCVMGEEFKFYFSSAYTLYLLL